MMPASTRPIAIRVALAVAVAGLLSACVAAGENPAASKTVAYIPNYQGGTTSAPVVLGYDDPAKTGSVVSVELGSTSPTQMFIKLSQSFAPAGKVSFLVTNTDTMTHEFVVLSTDKPADSFPLTTFEGESNRIDEDAKGVTNVGETGDMAAGTSQMLTLDLPEGHYAVVCNLKGHYAAGMHQDFWVTPSGATPVSVELGSTSPTQMFIKLSQSFAPAGKVSFLVTNTDTMTHEFVVLSTDKPADSFPLTTFEGESNRIDEDAKGVTNVGETGDMAAGTSQMLTLDLPEGHYAVVCNLKGHYAAGMHQDFWVTPLA